MAEISKRRRIWGWWFFDWASQPYHTLLVTFVFGPYFAGVAAEYYLASGLDAGSADAQAQVVWANCMTIVGLIIAFGAPLMGAMADVSGRRIPWIFAFSVMYAVGSGALWYTMPDGSNMWLMLSAFGLGFIGAEYAFQNPLVFEGGIYDDVDFYRYESFSNISVGGFFLPKINSITSYFHRVTYRAGFHYQKSGLVVNDTEIDEYGISFGVSLPIGLKLSNVNMGFEMGKRGTTDNNLIEENFYNFRLSLSLNDKWFRKQKIY